MREWLAFIAKAKTLEQQIYACERLHLALEAYRNTTVLDLTTCKNSANPIL
jgi:hypothetical protein